MTYIIIINYNTWQDTIECVNSIFNSTENKYKIIIVDNKSENESLNNLNSYFIKKLGDEYLLIYADYINILDSEYYKNKKLFLISSEDNLGFANGNNKGIRFALNDINCEYIWLLNNDTVIFPETLKDLLNEMKNDNHIGILGNAQMYYHNQSEIQALAGGFNKKKIKFFNIKDSSVLKDRNIIFFVYGASMFLRRKIFENVGLLNENYFLYYEEIDICERARKKNYKVKISESIKILHKHSKTISIKGNIFKYYYLERNKYLFLRKYFKKQYYLYIIKLPYNIIKYLLKYHKFDIISIKAFFNACILNEKKKSKYFTF